MAPDKEAKSGEVETPRKPNHTKESLQLLFENTDKIEFDSELYEHDAQIAWQIFTEKRWSDNQGNMSYKMYYHYADQPQNP